MLFEQLIRRETQQHASFVALDCYGLISFYVAIAEIRRESLHTQEKSCKLLATAGGHESEFTSLRSNDLRLLSMLRSQS